ILLFATLKRWRNFYNLQPNALSLNAAYDGIMTFGETTMNRLSRLFMTGILRTYLIYMFIAIVAIVLTTLFVKDAISIHFEEFSSINSYGLLTAIILTISVVMLVLAKKRMFAIIAPVGVSYSGTLLFIIFMQTELDLKQLVIETICVALFFLAFHDLPKLKRHGETKAFRLGNFIVALTVGTTMTLLALSAQSEKL